MHLLSRAKSSKARTAVLIVAVSARAMAAAARRAGYRPLAVDFFNDIDTREICAASRRAEGGLSEGFTDENLIPALTALAEGQDPCGIVYGAGFEDRPGLLASLAERFTLLGNPPDVVRCVKDPVRLVELCASMKIPHPEIRGTRPAEPQNWLVKRIGGSGGTHVAPASGAPPEGQGIYFQRRSEGVPISIQFLADGTKTQVIGFSRQWTAPAPDAPFRFGGILRPANLPHELDRRLREALAAVSAACGLRGLNTIDFLVIDNAYTLLEINPRPGAGLDIFEDETGSLFQAHINASLGFLPDEPLEFAGAAAAAIAYAPCAIASMPDLQWPDWTADRQRAGSALRAHDPVCTIKAQAGETSSARVLIEARTNLLLDYVSARRPFPPRISC
ncbi:MAG TPA: ATP-grasp domain-containing protein [Methylocella sp.]|nr:ATP-grasp domain-containing protein [Methylocella sp.]